MQANILIVDDNVRVYESLKPNLLHLGLTTYYAGNYRTAMTIVQNKPIDIVLMDIMLGEDNGIEALIKIKEHNPKLPVIMITGYASIDTAVESMRQGAFDYVKKPLEFDRLFKIIENALELNRLSKENSLLRKKVHDLSPKICVESPRMLTIMEQSRKLAMTDIPVLITGENGSGKEIIADYLYEHSTRSTLKMHKINCAAFPESLLDNELFGHDKGAYTGAQQDFKGIFERADGGTLFLDEIGDMPLTIQAKILRVLQNREIRRVGGTQTIQIDVRFIAATNQNLEELIVAGKFREDLFYRLNAATIAVPSLKERREDIVPLAYFFLEEFADLLGKPVSAIDTEVLDLFHEYSWPGNVRELKNAINYAISMTSTKQIRLVDLPPRIREKPVVEESQLSIMERMERALIERTLKEVHYNKKHASEILNMSRKTLYVKLAKYDIQHN